jgi:hypothetical protein
LDGRFGIPALHPTPSTKVCFQFFADTVAVLAMTMLTLRAMPA